VEGRVTSASASGKRGSRGAVRQNRAVLLPTAELKAKAIELGFDAVGVCLPVDAPHLAEYADWLKKGRHGGMAYLQRQLPLKGSPFALLPEAKSVIALALFYNQPNPQRPGYPRIAKYALGRDYHKVMRGKLKRLAHWIKAQHLGAKCRPCVDSAPIFERDYSHLAGLGWFGKNTCLIDSKRGSWFFIGLLLTSVEYAADAPSVGSCGTCRACIDACPTGAIIQEEGRWQIDSRRCISYLTIEHRGPFSPEQETMIGHWTFGCDVCQEVCPFNAERESQPMRSPISTEADFLQGRDWPLLEQLSQISYEDWDRLTRGSAVRRAGFDGLRRNARANMDNSKAEGL
jgi:epoxyqueuosine reductase